MSSFVYSVLPLFNFRRLLVSFEPVTSCCYSFPLPVPIDNPQFEGWMLVSSRLIEDWLLLVSSATFVILMMLCSLPATTYLSYYPLFNMQKVKKVYFWFWFFKVVNGDMNFHWINLQNLKLIT